MLGAGAALGVAALLGGALPGSTAVPGTRRAAGSPPDDEQAFLADARLLHDVVADEGLSPVGAARLLAYGAIAMAVVADGPHELVPVLATGPGPLPRPPAGLRAGTATAAALAALLPVVLGPSASRGLVRASAAVRLRLDPTLTDVHAPSLRHGREVGEVLAAWASADGFRGAIRPPYRPSPEAGSWRGSGGSTGTTGATGPTPPAGATGPTHLVGPPGPTDAWVSRTTRPFVVACDDLPAPRPLPFDLSVRSPYRAQVEDLVRLTSDLDADERAVARFWAAGAGTATPAGVWHLLAAQEAVRRPTATSPRTVLALVDVAVLDALLRCWEVKLTTDRARPGQVIPVTGAGRASWTPLLPTPPFPEYTSGHSSVSGAAAQVLQTLLGAAVDGVDVAPVAATATGLTPSRWFPGWHEVAQEASLSRQLGGIHFRQACEDGLLEGAEVGRRVLARGGWHDG